ncbi:hypothetical protein VIGAN_06052100, partial [Vigna angularis var. angularis]
MMESLTLSNLQRSVAVLCPLECYRSRVLCSVLRPSHLEAFFFIEVWSNCRRCSCRTVIGEGNVVGVPFMRQGTIKVGNCHWRCIFKRNCNRLGRNMFVIRFWM